MTASDTEQGTGPGLQVIYPNLVYEINLMSDYFSALGAVWSSSFQLTQYRLLESTTSEVFRRWTENAYREPSCHVRRLQIGSPMWMTFATEGGVPALATYATFLVAQVLRNPERVGAWLPRLVAGWHQAWREAEMHKGMREAERNKQKYPWDDSDDHEARLPRPSKPLKRTSERPAAEPTPPAVVQNMINAGTRLTELLMQPAEVSIVGADEIPGDLAALDDPDQSNW